MVFWHECDGALFRLLSHGLRWQGGFFKRRVVEREGFDVAPETVAATRSDVMRGDVSLHGGVGVPRQWGDKRRRRRSRKKRPSFYATTTANKRVPREGARAGKDSSRNVRGLMRFDCTASLWD